MGTMQISFSKESITPSIGTKLAGYGNGRVASQINDELYARIILLKENDDIFTFIQLDLLAIDYYFCYLLSEKLNEIFGIKKENLFINCIHTHSGTAGIINTEETVNKRYKSSFGECNNDAVNNIINSVISCVERCIKDMDFFSISYDKAEVENICTNRNDPSLPIDNELQILLITRNDGKKAIIYNFACHPTVMDGSNLSVTADFPGKTSKILEQLNEMEVALFYNGACGDISTRFTKKESSFQEVERIGSLLGKEILKLIAYNTPSMKVDKIRTVDESLWLDVKNLPSPERLEQIIKEIEMKINDGLANGLEKDKLKPYYFKLAGAKRNYDMLESFYDINKIELKIKIIRLDDIYMVYIPGELFSSLGIAIKKAFENKKIFIVGYSNGYIGYIPDREAYIEGGFEVMLTPLAEGEGEKLVDYIIELISYKMGE